MIELSFFVASEYYLKEDFKNEKKSLWEVIKNIKFANQIIENHKIVNFKESNYEYNVLVNNDVDDEETIIKCWLDLMKPCKQILNKATDGMLEKDKQKRIIQNG